LTDLQNTDDDVDINKALETMGQNIQISAKENPG
jgi:hypothetical protein